MDKIKDCTVRLETKADYDAVENLTREAFWNVYRPGCLEHYLIHILRDSDIFVPELDFVMEKDGEIIGHIAYAKSKIITDKGEALPVMTFGPISIAPEFKRQGYGSALLQYSMEKAKAMGCGALCTEGNFGFYGKSGFVLGKDLGIYYADDPDADYFIVRELIDGYLKGVSGKYKDPEVYLVDENAGEEFDKKFPPKEKLKLPGQLV